MRDLTRNAETRTLDRPTDRSLRVLVACEESQRVCMAFRERGHEAYSCDIIECSGGHPEWHIKGDVISVINGFCTFITQDGKIHSMNGPWDLIIAHPPCTFLTVTGNRHFNTERYGKKAEGRWRNRVDAAVFFMRIVAADCKHIAVENPIGIMNTSYRKPDQLIHPWMFPLSEEDKTEKNTCLWLKGLPKLKPWVSEKPEIAYKSWVDQNGRHKRQTQWYYQTRCLGPKERARAASKTFLGIAQAMAEQFGSYIMDGKNDMNQEKQITLWDWSPEDCPNQDTGGCGPDFDLSKHMNPPE